MEQVVVVAHRRPDGNVMVTRYTPDSCEYLTAVGDWISYQPFDLLPVDATLIPLKDS